MPRKPTNKGPRAHYKFTIVNCKKALAPRLEPLPEQRIVTDRILGLKPPEFWK